MVYRCDGELECFDGSDEKVSHEIQVETIDGFPASIIICQNKHSKS